jgi:NSS family neurotransmitter:Na+ symporter
VLVLWVLRRGPELRYHLNAVSTFKVGRLWVVLVGGLAPIVLGYMLVSRIVTLTIEGYAELPGWYLVAIGWGAIIAIIAGAAILTAVRWRADPEGLVVWPPYPPRPPVGSETTTTAEPPGPTRPSPEGGAS